MELICQKRKIQRSHQVKQVVRLFKLDQPQVRIVPEMMMVSGVQNAVMQESRVTVNFEINIEAV